MAAREPATSTSAIGSGILEAAQAGFADVVKASFYLTDMATFGAMNEAYGAFFPGETPARITLDVAGLALGASVEIECVARTTARR